MDSTLKTLHLRLDSTSKSLTKNAIGQIIIKMLYLAEKRLNAKEICQQVDMVFSASIEEQKIIDSINKLSGDKLIKEKKKVYYLSSSQKKLIKQAYSESESRLNRIIEEYFQPCETDFETVKTWLSETTMLFFNEYSTDWISDICKKSSHQVVKQKANILDLIKLNTVQNKSLSKDDRTLLCKKFIDFVISNENDVNSYLWEYGTSAFASTLINSSLGIDPLSLSAFKDSKCVLDTNVLMNIGLEASPHHKSFKHLDLIFSELNIQPGYFHITKEEYQRTIANKKQEILKNIEEFDFDVIQETDDNYVQTAILRKCKTSGDFEVFFDEVLDLPEYIDEKHKIILFDSDPKLEEQINTAANDEEKQKSLNDIFKSITDRDKRPNAIKHDVGLIAGNEYYRVSDKCFIISQEISINEYAKQLPSKKDLPFALRLETLFGMLAIDNGGTDINPNDCSNLFANIIRLNLIPSKNTFRITDLSKLIETEFQISQLPIDEIIEIAKDVHRNRSLGLKDEEVGLQLSRKFQGAKLKIVDDIETSKAQLSLAKIETEKSQKTMRSFKLALENRIREEEKEKLRKIYLKTRRRYLLYIPISITLLTLVCLYYFRNPESPTPIISYILGLIGNIGFWLLTNKFFTKGKLHKGKLNLEKYIEEQVAERMITELNNATQQFS